MFNALLFDMDGTMINNMAYHLRAWEQMMEELGHPMRGEQLLQQLYGSNKGVLDRIFGEGYFDAATISLLSDRKEALYRTLYQPHIKLIAGLDSFLRQQHECGMLMALGTASNMPNINLTLDTLRIRHYFKTIVSADDVQRGKPDPETYLRAAEWLNVSPANCLVFEDVPKGVEAAAAAGMQVVVVTTTHTPEEFSSCKNVLTFIPDFTNFRLDNY